MYSVFFVSENDISVNLVIIFRICQTDMIIKPGIVIAYKLKKSCNDSFKKRGEQERDSLEGREWGNGGGAARGATKGFFAALKI